jgi:hypothetical protein
MAILKAQEIHFAKLVPARPDKNKLDPTKPNWNLQCRTVSKEQRKEWVDMGLKPRIVRVDAEDDESAVKYYSVNFRKSAIKVDKTTTPPTTTKSAPPTVVNGRNEDIDPATIGNGSIANLRLYKREYELAGVKKVSYTLMGIQLVKHKLYISTPMEEFEETETETIVPDAAPSAADDEEDLY